MEISNFIYYLASFVFTIYIILTAPIHEYIHILFSIEAAVEYIRIYHFIIAVTASIACMINVKKSFVTVTAVFCVDIYTV